MTRFFKCELLSTVPDGILELMEAGGVANFQLAKALIVSQRLSLKQIVKGWAYSKIKLVDLVTSSQKDNWKQHTIYFFLTLYKYDLPVSNFFYTNVKRTEAGKEIRWSEINIRDFIWQTSTGYGTNQKNGFIKDGRAIRNRMKNEILQITKQLLKL